MKGMVTVKRWIMLGIMVIALSINSYAASTEEITQLTIDDWFVDTLQGQITLDDYNNLYIDGEYTINLSLQSAEEYPADLMKTLHITDMTYWEARRSVMIVGLVIDNKMHLEQYGDNMSMLVGTPSVVIMEYRLPTLISKKGRVLFHYLLEGPDIYGYPYNADNFYDSANDADYHEAYAWYADYPNPKLAKSYDANKLWFFGQFTWPHGPLVNENEYMLVFSIDFMTTGDLEMTHYMYLLNDRWELAAQESKMPQEYRQNYRYTNNGFFIQEKEDDHDVVQLINMMNDDMGMVFEFDLSNYGFPKYIKTYYK